jgi:hypothetical protein
MARKTVPVVWSDHQDEVYLMHNGAGTIVKPVIGTRVRYAPNGATYLAVGKRAFSDLTVEDVKDFYNDFVAHQKGLYGEHVFYQNNPPALRRLIKRAAEGAPLVYFNDQGYFSSSKGKLIAYLEQLREGEKPDWQKMVAFCKNKNQQMCLARVMRDGVLDAKLAVLASTRGEYEECARKYGAPEKRKWADDDEDE